MDRNSPLKQWARKISPSKSRNKPLPQAPNPRHEGQESPTRPGPQPTSAKSHSQEQVQTVSGQRKSSMSKMRNLFSSGNKEHPRRISPPPQRPIVKEPHQRSKTPDILSTNSRSGVSKDHMRRHSTLSPGSLTQRIFALESELATTKRELARFQTHKFNPSRHARHELEDQEGHYDQEVEARYRRLVGQGHLDGVMETLMGSPERQACEYHGFDGPRQHHAIHHVDQDYPIFATKDHHKDASYINKGRTVSAPQAILDTQARESILSAQQSRAEAELKVLRTQMRHAAWEQVQEQARAQLQRQSRAHGAAQPSTGDRPPSRGKNRSSSAPSHPPQHSQASEKPVLRRVQGGLKKDLPALPEDSQDDRMRRCAAQALVAHDSIHAAAAPLKTRSTSLSAGEGDFRTDYVFPPPPEVIADTSVDDATSPGAEAGQPRKAHRRRPSERDINFMHESKRSRTNDQGQMARSGDESQHNGERRQAELAHLTGVESVANPAGKLQSSQKAPLSESTSPNVPKATKTSAKDANRREVVEETETIDLNALSTPTKKYISRHLERLERDSNRENDCSIADESDSEAQDEEPFELGQADTRPPSPERRHLPHPTRLETVREDFEWDDDIF